MKGKEIFYEVPTCGLQAKCQKKVDMAQPISVIEEDGMALRFCSKQHKDAYWAAHTASVTGDVEGVLDYVWMD